MTGVRGRPAVRTAALLLLGLFLVSSPACGQAPAEPFFGTYVGRAQVFGPAGELIAERDIDIAIAPAERGGFTIRWANVTLFEGRRDVPGVQRHVGEVLFRPSDEPGIYVQETRGSLFEERRRMNYIGGDPLRWASISNGRLGMYSMVIYEDGSFELQSFIRTLTPTGMLLEFHRLENGQITRTVTGRAVRVGMAAADEEEIE